MGPIIAIVLFGAALLGMGFETGKANPDASTIFDVDQTK